MLGRQKSMVEVMIQYSHSQTLVTHASPHLSQQSDSKMSLRFTRSENYDSVCEERHCNFCSF